MAVTQAEERNQFQALEEEYWEAFDNGDIGKLQTIIHRDRFLGCTSKGRDLSRDGLLTKVDENREKPPLDPKIRLLKHIVTDDAAITLVSRIDERGSKVVTHTWIRQGEQWIMIGGMSQTVSGST